MKKYILSSLIIATTVTAMEETDFYEKAMALLKADDDDELFDFEHCIINGDEEKALQLLKEGNVRVQDVHVAMMAKHGRKRLLEKVLSGNFDLNPEPKKPLFRQQAKNNPRPLLADAIEGNCPEIVRLLLERGSSHSIRFLSSDHWTTPLALAKRLQHAEITEILEATNAEEYEEYIEGYDIGNPMHNPEREAMQSAWRKKYMNRL